MKKKVLFECIECGYQSVKYFGKCPQCSNWNTMVEVKEDKDDNKRIITQKPQKLSEIDTKSIKRIVTEINEFDRVLGGGIVPESVVLIGGEPGVGKSTLLLSVSSILSRSNKKVLYFTGEESLSQIKMRSERLNLKPDNLYLISMIGLEELKSVVKELKPDFLIIDSIQTINSEKTGMIGGSIASLKYITSELIDISKNNGITVFIVGHITKEGQIAGPKMLEHMVDVVLYFQGEIQTDIRILRAVKNRYGPLDEIGVFQMTSLGLKSVSNPSLLFLNHRKGKESGISVFPVIKGMRAILIEVQSLVTESPFVSNPRRISIGYDSYRMAMLISIIEKKLKLPFYKHDVFLNITGGIVVKDAACDLSVISSLISSYKNILLPIERVSIGEIGLTGEIRPVSNIQIRVKEAIRQGFKKILIPSSQSDMSENDIKFIPVSNIYELYDYLKS